MGATSASLTGMPSNRVVLIDLPRVFIGSAAVEQGLVTARQLRGHGVVPVLHGVYRPAWVELTHELCCEAASLVLPSQARVTGRSAATVRGVPLAGARDDVEVIVPFGMRAPRLRGVAVRQTMTPGPPDLTVNGVRLAHPLRIAFDLAARRAQPRAVAYLDAIARAGIVDLDALRIWLATCHDNDVVAVRDALELTDPRAESIPESEMRVILRRAGFTPEVQYVVRHNGRRILRADLALADLRIAILYDGAWHALREQLEKDRAQQRLLQQADWLTVHVTAELLRTPSALVATVAAMVGRRQSPR